MNPIYAGSRGTHGYLVFLRIYFACHLNILSMIQAQLTKPSSGHKGYSMCLLKVKEEVVVHRHERLMHPVPSTQLILVLFYQELHRGS